MSCFGHEHQFWTRSHAKTNEVELKYANILTLCNKMYDLLVGSGLPGACRPRFASNRILAWTLLLVLALTLPASGEKKKPHEDSPCK